MDLPSGVSFRERQFFRQPWLIAIMLASVFVPAGMLLALTPREEGGLAVAIGVFVSSVVLAALFFCMRLDVAVGDDGVRIRFPPIVNRTIAFDDIRSCVARTYRPIWEYGGWGIRFGPSGTAYNVSGNRGVQLTLRNGKRILIGSQRADELAAAISAHLPLHTPSSEAPQ
jgi:hypothetical protein